MFVDMHSSPVRTVRRLVPATILFAALASATLSPAVADDSWLQCAEEGDNCNFNAGSWAIRYGNTLDDGDSWYYYTEYNSSSSFIVQCENDVFGDSLKGHDKICQYRRVYDSPNDDDQGCSKQGSTTQCGYQAASDALWSQCAKEGDDCKGVSTSGLVALRYGSYEANKWSVRNWSSTGAGMECSNKAWGFDPAKGYDKVCEWAALPSYAMRGVAYQWQTISGTCDNCTAPQITTQVGVSLSEGTSTTAGFSASISAQVSESANIGIGIDVISVGATVGVQLGASLSANWSRTVSQTTTESESISETFTCSFTNQPENSNVVVYQFVTSSYRIGAGTVDVGNIMNSSFVCIATPKGQPLLTPACLPNYFDSSDPTGQTCLPGGDLISS